MATRKARKYCIAYGCLNKNRNYEFSFFSLPKDSKRCQEWLALINREDLLTKPNFKPRHHYVCSAHFNDSSFKANRLKRCALPIKITPEQLQESSLFQADLIQKSEKETQTSLTAQNLRKRKLSEESHNSQYKCLSLDDEIIIIKEELEGKNTRGTNEHSDDLARIFHKLLEWQNRFKNKFKENLYDLEFKTFALNLYYASPLAYRFLQPILKLPNKATINNFKINIPPKLDDRVFKSLEFKIKSLPDTAKYCTLCVDEMTLKRNLYYDTKTDEIIGFHNMNGKISPEIASNAYTIMLQGIHIKWRQPLAYALLASVKDYEQLDLWLEEVISKLFTIGIKVKAIISDQGSNFDKFAKEIKNITVDKPYFMYDTEKIFYIFDVPHLIKCIRNHLITSDFHYDGKKISWDFIKQLYDDQKGKNLRLIPKITDSHIDPNNFKKMRVKYAVQVFSRTVSAALHTYIDLGIISEEARPTANFVETMNNLFDILNSSKMKCTNKYGTAFTRSDYQENVLDYALEMFSKIKAIINKKTNKSTAHMKSFINAQISIQSIRMLYEDLGKEGIKYLFTRRLNRDCLDIFFVSIRRQSGSCIEPTPIQFKRAFSKLFLSNMLKSSPDANCKTDLYDMLLQAEDVMDTYQLSISASSETSVVCLDGETDHRLELPKENTLTYVSGYLLFKCMSKHRCHSIDAAMKLAPDLEKTNMFTKCKTANKQSGFHGTLKLPPKKFNLYIRKLEVVFRQNFDKTIHGHPGAELYELMQAVQPQTLCTCFPLNYLLKLFVRLRIYATLRFNNQTIKTEICNRDQ